jgi:hypothetical protein
VLDFPANPTSGDLYGSWIWDGEKWISTNAPAAVTASDTPPPNPKPGDLWFDTVGLALYVRYDDGTSVQWVVTINQPTLPDAKSDGFLYGRQDGAWSSGGTLSGNLGLGVDPPANQAPAGVSGSWMFGWGVTINNWANNAYYDGANWRYQSDGFMWNQQMSGGSWSLQCAPSGVADSVASPIDCLAVDTSGNLTVAGSIYPNGEIVAKAGIGINGDTASENAFRVSTAGYMRWYWGKNAQAETGNEAGSVYFLASCYDTGGYKATAFTVARTDMTVAFSYPIYNPSTRAGKQNVAPLTEALPKILSLDGIAYDADNGERYLGLVAEDVQKVIPEIVAERSIGPESEAMLCISYQQMVPVLIEAIKTLTARVAALEGK